jgi:uncharacterized membrane protein
MYNIHPIIVHFPIAMLVIYCVIEIIPVRTIFKKIQWQSVSDVLLVVGALGTLASMVTGEAAEHSVMAMGNHDLVEMHALFASITTWVACVLLGDRLLSWLWPMITRFVPSVVVRFVSAVLAFVRNKIVHILLVVLGFIALVMTGILGGAIVYGTTADPLAPVVMDMLQVSDK